MTRAIIMANGSQARWNGYLGVPKQEIVIDGETLIGRMVRLLLERGVDDILISGPFGGYGVPMYSPIEPFEAVDGRLGIVGAWNPLGRTIILMGDVYYTDAAMATIVGHPTRDHHLFARFGPSQITGKPWPEIFADSFWPEHHAEYHLSLWTVQGMLEMEELDRAGLWESYMLDHGQIHSAWLNDGRVTNYGNATEIDDWTEDFDYPEDFDRFMARRERAA